MSALKLFKLAWRNLWRNRRRTGITLSSIGLGTMLAVLFTGIGDSNWQSMIDLAARLGGGHVSLEHREYRDVPTFAKRLVDTFALRERALADPDVERVVVRISGQMMLASGAHSQGAAFIAFEPGAEDLRTLSLLDAIVEGSAVEDDADRGVLLGQKLAENLRVVVGRKVVLSLTDKNGEIVQEAARVRGIVRTGAPTVDGSLVLLTLGRMQEILRYAPDEAITLGLFLSDQRAAYRVAERLKADLPAYVAALTWQEVQPELAGFIAMKVGGARFLEAVIMVLVAAGIFNTLFVGVMERVREFGIMLALGYTPGLLFGLIMCESGWLALTGLVVAALLTSLPYSYLSSVGVDISAQLEISGVEVAGIALDPIMRAAIYPENLLMIACAVVLATLASGLYPAWRASRIQPVEAIRLV
jgi:ABC-type lipoprotein release transport system permease subunit